MSAPSASNALQRHAAEGRDQHGEVEADGVGGAVQGLVVDQPVLDLRHVRAENGLHTTLTEQRARPQFASGLEALLVEHHAAHAEVAQRGFVGEVDHPGQVADAGFAQFVVDVEDVLEGRPLTGAGAVPHADHEGLRGAGLEHLDHLAQPVVGLDGMIGGAHALGEPARAHPLGGLEPQPRPGRVDQVVVAQPFGGSGLLRRGVLDVDPAARIVAVTPRVKCDRLGLFEPDALAGIHRGQREDHVLLGHFTDADPDVRRNPVPLRVRRDHGDAVFAAQQSAQVQRRRMARHPRTQNDDLGHHYPSRRQHRLRFEHTHGGTQPQPIQRSAIDVPVIPPGV